MTRLARYVSRKVWWRANRDDGDERQAEITDADQDPVQRRLIHDDPSKDRGPVPLVGDLQLVEPGRPVTVELCLNGYFVVHMDRSLLFDDESARCRGRSGRLPTSGTRRGSGCAGDVPVPS